MKLKLIFITEIVTIFLIALGILPREAALFLTGALTLYIIFSPLKDGLVLTIASIPLYVALPVLESFDLMANWRIILAVLFLTLLIKQQLKFSFKQISIKTKLRLTKLFSMRYLVCLFLFIGLLSLINAVDATAGIKKLLFLINIFLLYIVIREVAKDKETIVRLLGAGAIAGIISLIVGYAQFISIFFISLHRFWLWWASRVIPLFYGQALANLLRVSNTWFSYYPNKPPTLRMFSVFPDSHSFAMFSILLLPFLLALGFHYLKKSPQIINSIKSKSTSLDKSRLLKFRRIFGELERIPPLFLLLATLSFLAIILSGSRGAWISAGGTIIIIGIFYLLVKIFKKFPQIHNIKVILTTFLIFVLLFPLSSLILNWSQRSEGKLTTQRDISLVFERAKSSIDIGETSVRSRWDIWKATLASIKKHPFLGVGVGNYPVVLREDISATKRGASAHNLYMDVASEMGVLGLIILLLIFWQILKTSWITFKNSSDKLFKFFACAFSVYFVWVLGYSLFDVVLLNDKVLMLFVAAVGILYSIRNKANRPEEFSSGQ